MKFPILASFIVFILILSRAMKKQSGKKSAEEKSFWELEREANNVRRKPLDNLEYIQIPPDLLSIRALSGDETAEDCLDTLRTLSEQKIVNLTGYTNTELKLEYGAPNISALTQFDQNYTLLVCTLQKLADRLYAAGFIGEARSVLEFAVSTRTDVSKSYYMLAELYDKGGETEKIRALAETAEALHSVSRGPIVRTLREAYPYIG